MTPDVVPPEVEPVTVKIDTVLSASAKTIGRAGEKRTAIVPSFAVMEIVSLNRPISTAIVPFVERI